MKKTIKAGLAMTFAALFLVGCTSEEATIPSQVAYQDVNIQFVDATLEQMGGSHTRGDETSLSESFKRLDVALISQNDTTIKYTTTQCADSTTLFGTVTMRVPTGKYTLVGVAHKSIQATTPSAKIESAKSVTFANNVIGDVAYVKQDVTVNTTNSTATACSLQRAVALFRIKCQDDIPADAKKIKINFEKNCGFRFSPTTGFTNNTSATYLSFAVNKTADEEKAGRSFGVYTFLSGETVKTNVTVTTYDGNEKVLNTMTFNDVTLQVNHVTTYTGKFFTAGEGMSFSFTQGDFVPSAYDLDFDE